MATRTSNFTLLRPTARDRPISAAASHVGRAFVLVAEAVALRDSLVKAKEKKITRVEVEGDSKLVIEVVKSQIDPFWRLIKLVQDIRRLATSFDSISFRHVFREANFVADAIANLGHSIGSNLCWNYMIPSETSRSLLFDILNSGCPRGFDL
ncbi:hypothetical protein ACLB2K_006825 [Fragaria x ananassa]